jgi:MFS family permease
MATEQVGMTASGVPTAQRDGGGRWLVVLAMAVPLLMLTIDAFGLTVALPAIGHALDTSTTTLAWVLNAFLFAFAAPQIAAGRLADTFGRRRVVLLGLITCIVGSVAAGIAQSITWLITARALQGLGTALSFVASLAIVSNAFPPAQRGQAIGIWAAAGTIGQALGPLVGGVLTEKLSWLRRRARARRRAERPPPAR